ncbi:CHAT domain-containing protein [Trichophaea hybrida]|nr:CHAT domain-containing protein [Trichophaea hybrida]
MVKLRRELVTKSTLNMSMQAKLGAALQVIAATKKAMEAVEDEQDMISECMEPSLTKLRTTNEDLISIKLGTTVVTAHTPVVSNCMFNIKSTGLPTDSSNPFKSCLLLKNEDTESDKPGVLSIRQMAERRTANTDLAYLSTCSTANNLSTLMTNEVIHLANGFQLAGLKHVVSTLWKTKDSVYQEIETDFFRTLNEVRREGEEWPVSVVLHRTVMKAREKKLNQPLVWAPFIHVGG